MEQFNCDYLHAIKTRTKLTNRPGFFPGQSLFGTLCPGIPNVIFGTPKCPGLAPDVPGGTEFNPHNQLSLSVWRFLNFLRWFCDLC